MAKSAARAKPAGKKAGGKQATRPAGGRAAAARHAGAGGKREPGEREVGAPAGGRDAAARRPRRLAHTAPAQQRAHRTLARIVSATERLLRKQSFEELTIAEIVTEAKTSTGSFYARFGSKEALLPYLYEIYNTDAAARPSGIESVDGLDAASLGEGVAAFVARAMGGVRQTRWMLRAMTIYARTYPERLPKSAAARSERIYATALATFAPGMRGRGDEDAERRARFAAYAIVTLAREHELFGEAPLAAALGLSREDFEAELGRMAGAYLGDASN